MVEKEPITTEQKWTKLMERVAEWLTMLFWTENAKNTMTKEFLEEAVDRGNTGDDKAKKAEMSIISGIIKRYVATEYACPGGRKPGNPESTKAVESIWDNSHLVLRLLTLRDNKLRDKAKITEICVNRVNRLIKENDDITTAEDVITFLKGDVQ
jgi:hypothetical protein